SWRPIGSRLLNEWSGSRGRSLRHLAPKENSRPVTSTPVRPGNSVIPHAWCNRHTASDLKGAHGSFCPEGRASNEPPARSRSTSSRSSSAASAKRSASPSAHQLGVPQKRIFRTWRLGKLAMGGGWILGLSFRHALRRTEHVARGSLWKRFDVTAQ